MPVNEETRHEVYDDLKRVHGGRMAGLIMEMFPPAGAPELATKDDVAVLRTELQGEIQVVRSEILALRAEIQAAEARMGERLERALHEQTTRFVRWMLALGGLTIAASSAAAGLVARGSI